MRNIFSKITLLYFLLVFTKAHSEIYSWVDKEGKKHFGEDVPKEYLKQSAELQVKPINGMEPTKVAPDTQETERDSFHQQPNRRLTPPHKMAQPTKKLSSCEQQKRAFEASARCYDSCRTMTGEPGHQTNDVSQCGRCVDVKKPNCD